MIGNTALRQPPSQPPAGSQCKVTANNRINNGATTNFGIAKPRPATNISA
jgi:hypothetical protein